MFGYSEKTSQQKNVLLLFEYQPPGFVLLSTSMLKKDMIKKYVSLASARITGICPMIFSLALIGLVHFLDKPPAEEVQRKEEEVFSFLIAFHERLLIARRKIPNCGCPSYTYSWKAS